MKREVIKGHLDLLLLAAVHAGAGHGYAIIEELRRRSGGTFDLAEGTVYPALHRLEAAGLLRSRETLAGGRRRRVYAVTKRGVSALERKRSDWWQFAHAVAAVLGEPA